MMSKKSPQLRFEGFTDDWEERKSKDIFKPKIRKGEPDLPVLSVTQTSGVVYRDEVGIDIKYDISTLKNYKVIEPNDFVISLRSFQGGFELSDKLGITSPAYTIFVPKSPEEQNNLFWRIQFKRFQFIQSLKTVTFGIRDGKSISFNEFGELKIKFPSNILEQQKIGAFFKKLDDTIALHQRKLDLLKEQKKGYLQKMFPKNGAKVPELRFAGFADDWEERKLSSISERVTRKNKNNESTLPLTISAQDGLIDQNDFFNKQVASRDVTGYFLVKNGEFAYNKSYSNGYPWGAIKRLDKYDMGVLSTLYIVFRPTEINSQFLVSYYDTTRWYREVSKNAAEGARNHGLLNIAPTDFFNTLLVVPKIVDEQEKIGAFFKQLDDTIALHQRKLDLLKEQKKGYLQKMFPKNGAKVPELRFAGFVDDWEERKLGDISYKVKEKNKTGEFTETLTNSAEYGIINQRDFFDKDISNAKNLTGYYVVKNDDFVYNPRISNFAPVGPIKRNKLGRTGVMSPLYYVFRTHDIDKNYFEKYFDTVYWHRFMELNGDSGARADRFAIKDSVFVEMPIPYPTMDEQQKIGSFFQQLDNTITLHQLKLDLLKEQKKGFLQKMFA